MKVALCCIGRLENKYAVEFVEHYKNLGFDKIFIYDNNYDGEEYFEDVLQNYINDNFVEIIDYRNKQWCQVSAYTDCYNKHNKEYDWIAFFDFDEFLRLVNHKTIKEFLSKEVFNNFQCIYVNWMLYSDNNLITYDERPIQERFTEPLPYDTFVEYYFPENNHIKSIIKGGINDFIWEGNPHTPIMPIKCCNTDGIEVENEPCHPYTFNECYLKHYTTKTIEEYMKNKMIKGTAGRLYKDFLDTYGIQRFFRYNKMSKEKAEYMLDTFGIDIYKPKKREQ